MQNLGILASNIQTVVRSDPEMSPLSCPGIMLLQMFVLLCPAKVYSSSSTIDDTILEELVDPSDVSYTSDQVNEEDSVFKKHQKINF